MPLAEHDEYRLLKADDTYVSIHVPLAEHDCLVQSVTPGADVSIHVPLAEHDAGTASFFWRISRFQFTCPSRSTTQVAALAFCL